eukprot:GSChrysophyteH1.ASY1.ANO1.2754.1 assembled CDS
MELTSALDSSDEIATITTKNSNFSPSDNVAGTDKNTASGPLLSTIHKGEDLLKHLADNGQKAVDHIVGNLGDGISHVHDKWESIVAHASRSRRKSLFKKRGAVFNFQQARLRLAKQKADAIVKQRKDALVVKDFNFAIGEGANCKLVRYEEFSCVIFSRKNKFRQFFVRLMNDYHFEGFILFMILLNSIFFSIADYSYVDLDGTMLTKGSWRNTLLIDTNLLFTIVFTFEAMVKIIGQGFRGRHGYINDPWNVLDFIVVISALLTMLPGLRDIVKSIFASLPELGGVFSLLGFIFLVFAIAGIEIFGGPSNHARCRATPYPVRNDFDVNDNPELTKQTSPWFFPQDCYWPIKETNDQVRLCSLGLQGMNICQNNVDNIPESEWSWCGSNFDGAGNRRFKKLNWGYTNFDNFGNAFLTIFQSITEEGWSHILYMNQDSKSEQLAGIYFCMLILLGCFFVLQLLLAVLEDNFHSAKEAVRLANEEQRRLATEALEKEERRQRMAADIANSMRYNASASRRGDAKGDENDASRMIVNMLRRNSSRVKASRMAHAVPQFSGNVEISSVHKEELREADPSSEKSDVEPARSCLSCASGPFTDLLRPFLKLIWGEKETRNENKNAKSVVMNDTLSNAKESIFCSSSNSSLDADSNEISHYQLLCLHCKKIAEWKYFELISGVLILINCFTLMADHHPMNPDTASGLDMANASLTLAFFFEMNINLLAFGPAFYVKDGLSSFDAFVVFASMVDLVLAPPAVLGSTGVDISSVSSISSVISILRCFRLFRIVKLAIRVKSLKILFLRVAKTFADLGTYMILLVVLIFIYTVVGLQFFSNRFRFDANGENIVEIRSEKWFDAPEVPRYNFDDFTSSFASVFQIITTENWNDILYNSWRVYGPMGFIFPVSLVMVGTFILMNLFLGILLSNFDEKADLGDSLIMTSLVNRALVARNSRLSSMKASTAENRLASLKSSPFLRSPSKIVPLSVDLEKGAYETIDDDQFEDNVEDDSRDVYPFEEVRTLGIFASDNPVRIFCGQVLGHPYFETFIQLLILLSSISLAIDSPLDDPDGAFRAAMLYFEWITTLLFTLETIVKVIVYGFMCNSNAYMRSGWNVLDFVIVVISLASLFDDGGKLKALKSIRSLRALRPLRVISRAPGLRTIVNAVFDSIPDVINVIIVVLVCFSIFAVIGVNFLKGDLRHCAGSNFD